MKTLIIYFGVLSGLALISYGFSSSGIMNILLVSLTIGAVVIFFGDPDY